MSLEPALAFHSLKSKGSTLLDTANKFEFQSRTPIEDAIKVVMVCSNQNDLDDLLQFKRGSQARKQKNASVQVNFENRAPTPIPEHRVATSLKSEEPTLGKEKFILSKGRPSKPLTKNHQNVRKSVENIPLDIWKNFRRPQHGSIDTDIER